MRIVRTDEIGIIYCTVNRVQLTQVLFNRYSLPYIPVPKLYAPSDSSINTHLDALCLLVDSKNKASIRRINVILFFLGLYFWSGVTHVSNGIPFDFYFIRSYRFIGLCYIILSSPIEHLTQKLLKWD